MRTLTLALLLTVSLAAAGCRRKPEITAADRDRMMRDVRARAGELQARGATNEVVLVLSDALLDKNLAGFRPDLFRDLLRIQLAAGDLQAAQDAYLKTAAGDPGLAAAGFGIIESSLAATGRRDELRQWCESLLTRNLPAPVPEQLYSRLLGAANERGDTNSVIELAGRCAAALPPDAGTRVLSHSLTQSLNTGDIKGAGRLLDFLAERFGGQPAYASMVGAARVRVLLKQSRVEEAADLVVASEPSLTDADLSRAAGPTVAAAGEAGRRDVAERVCAALVAARPADSATFRMLGRQWVLLARDGGDLPEAQRRLATLDARRPPAGAMLRACSDLLYPVMDKGDAGAKRGMLELCESLLGRASEEADKSWASMLLLDACFATGSFDRALALLEAGIPGRNRAWHDMLIPKVKAHKALAENRVEDAIGHFREFMEGVAKSREPLLDPSSDQEVPLAEVLGLNAARIGDLWTSIKDTAKAQAAYDEARRHYQAAIEKAAPNSEESRRIEDRLKALPAAPAPAAAAAAPEGASAAPAPR